MNKEINLSEEIISSRIYRIRGQKIMLDRDLAELYGVETRVLKQAVRRNLKRFPEDFMFEMTKEEFDNWRSQNVTSDSDKFGLRYAPFCFTEQGATMLSCILKSDRAIAVNIQIIRVFIKLRGRLNETLILRVEIEQIKKELSENGKNIGLIFDYLDGLIQTDKDSKTRKRIGYKP